MVLCSSSLEVQNDTAVSGLSVCIQKSCFNLLAVLVNCVFPLLGNIYKTGAI